MRNTIGNITTMSFDMGEALSVKSFPLYMFIQIVDGMPKIKISQEKFKLKLDCGIVLPANASDVLNTNVRFKVISTF